MAQALSTDGGDRGKVKHTACAFMGLSHILYLQDYIKGAAFAVIEVAFICFIPFISKVLYHMVTLRSDAPHPMSSFMIVDGVLAISVIALFAAIYAVSVQSAVADYDKYCILKHFPSSKNSLETITGAGFPIVGLTPLVVLLVIFVVVPLVFSVLVSFTSYSNDVNPVTKASMVKLFDWVGLRNFKELLGGGSTWSKGFGRVAVWTLIWAVAATFTCYFGGLLIAVLLQESKISIAPVFRIIYILPYAVPAVITMLMWKNLLNGTFGTVDRTLMQFGFIQKPIPFLSDPTLAKVMCVVVNLWAGFGYFMILSMGTMSAISGDIFEAARIDGASPFQTLRAITVPLVMYQTMPQIIMSLTHNLNNFGMIFFFTGGDPSMADSATTSAGGTDILVTWIYKLTMNLQKYHYASVIAVLIFIVIAPFAIITFRQTKSYKEGTV